MHFLAVAAQTMRRVLVDLVRAQRTLKRGAQPPMVELDSMIAAPAGEPVDLIALDRALEGLAAIDAAGVRTDSRNRSWLDTATCRCRNSCMARVDHIGTYGR